MDPTGFRVESAPSRLVNAPDSDIARWCSSDPSSDPYKLPTRPPKFGYVTRVCGRLPYEDIKERAQALWKSLHPLELWEKASKRTWLLDSCLGRFIRSNKVLGRAFQRWNVDPPECETEQMRGGGYNQIIGLNIPETYKVPSSIDRQFILRIPRDDDGRLDRDVANLEYVRDKSTILVPEIVHKDYTADNPLGFPYMIQKRMPGRCLQAFWRKLNVEQRCSVASDLAKTLRKLQSLTGLSPGVIEKHEEVGKGLQRTITAPYDLVTHKGVFKEPERDSLNTHEHKSTFELIIHQIDRWMEFESAQPISSRLRKWGYSIDRWNKLRQAVIEMEVLGLLNDNTFTLCHLDLQLRNIMGEIQDDKTVKITGYLDWDSAVIAPSFVGCAPPTFLWYEGPGSDNEEEERGANMKPMDPINRRVKQVFDDTVGREYLHFAYDPRFRLARMLFRVAKEGIWDLERAGKEATEFLDDWSDLQRLLLPKA